LNKRDVRRKLKYSVRWKRYIVEENTWKRLEKLKKYNELSKIFLKKD